MLQIEKTVGCLGVKMQITQIPVRIGHIVNFGGYGVAIRSIGKPYFTGIKCLIPVELKDNTYCLIYWRTVDEDYKALMPDDTSIQRLIRYSEAMPIVNGGSFDDEIFQIVIQPSVNMGYERGYPALINIPASMQMDRVRVSMMSAA